LVSRQQLHRVAIQLSAYGLKRAVDNQVDKRLAAFLRSTDNVLFVDFYIHIAGKDTAIN
jgi:hypothetical protein